MGRIKLGAINIRQCGVKAATFLFTNLPNLSFSLSTVHIWMISFIVLLIYFA